jgi:trehalose/maltose transport system substrate-binding protein
MPKTMSFEPPAGHVIKLKADVDIALLEPFFEKFAAETGAAVVVEVPGVPAIDYLTEIRQALESGSSEIDVYLIDVIWPRILAEHALNLAAYLPAAAIEQHPPAVLENNTVAGKLVALPYYIDVGLLYYRPDLLAKYGFDGPPVTWAELEAMALTIQTGEREAGNAEFWGFVWQGQNYEGLTCDALEWQFAHGGGRIIEPDGTITINNPQAIAAFERAAAWVGAISPPDVTAYLEEDARGVWQNGNAAFMRNWPYAFALGNQAGSPIKDKFSVAVLPTGGAHPAATLGGWHLMASKYSKQPELAAQLVQLLTGREVQKALTISAASLPSYEALYRDPDVLAAWPYLAGLLPVIESAVARPSTVTGEQYAEVSAAYHNHVHAILAGQTSAAEGVARLEAELADITGFRTGPPPVVKIKN